MNDRQRSYVTSLGRVVRIDVVLPFVPPERRHYVIRVTNGDVTTVYACKVAQGEVLGKTDQQLADYLAHDGRKSRLFAFNGPAS